MKSIKVILFFILFLSSCNIHPDSENAKIMPSPSLVNGISPTKTAKILSSITPTSTVYATPYPVSTATHFPTATLLPSMTPIVFISTNVPADLRRYIGGSDLELPTELNYDAGFLVDGREDYSLSFMTRNREFLIMLAYKHKILDILELPELGIDDTIGAMDCKLGDKIDPEIVTIALLDEESYYKRIIPNENIRLAWRVNLSQGFFESIPVSGITCGEGGWDPNMVGYRIYKMGH